MRMYLTVHTYVEIIFKRIIRNEDFGDAHATIIL